jgi:hypothetical protein
VSNRINHVSVNATNLEESVDFYVDVLGAERVATPNFGPPVQWLELPGDLVQLYVRDPAGNLVEIDHVGADRLPDDLRAQIKPLWDFNPQDDEQMSARLFVPE